MNIRIKENLENKNKNRILPFLWMHGEPHERLKEEILAIRESGLDEFCAESRPYENFCKEQWWEDFGFVLKTAEKLGMKVWLLDDKKFPTGYANGYLEAEERAHLRKVLIRNRVVEVVGPAKNQKIWLGGLFGKGEQLVSAVMYRHVGSEEELDGETAIDITDTCADDCLYFDIPKGVWRVSIAIKTDATKMFGANDIKRFYIDMLNPDSCRAMIEAVYEPQYKHFKKYFGTTFKGFFSDEPGFLNIQGSYHDTLGNIYEPYPWRDDMPKLIAKSSGMKEAEVKKLIHAIWEDLGKKTSLIRFHYMEVISKLYSENFCFALGNWCREHNVMYIGHVIEDNNAHMRMGYGAGHFFRALAGQDMAGMDLVLFQVVPGILNGAHRGSLPEKGYVNPEFFHYTLPKLCASHSHIDPLKKGRAMCEIFGAFGWGEGLSFMKQLADVTLASGINYFVPHAFSSGEDDPDSPPHFYNGGKFPQFALFKNLMDYMNRTANVMADGVHRASAAVFYNAESEWTGGKKMLFERVCTSLTKGLIDYDIIPYDVLKKAKVIEGKLAVGKETFGALVISESEIMSKKTLELLEKLKAEGLRIIFVNSLPKRDEYGTKFKGGFEKVTLSSLVKKLRSEGLYEIEAKNAESLRFYHISKGKEDIYMFSNEAIRENIDTYVNLPFKGEYTVYDAWENKCFRGKTTSKGLHLVLEKGNAIIVTFGSEVSKDLPPQKIEKCRKPLDLKFNVAVREMGEKTFVPFAEGVRAHDITAPGVLPHFEGELLYETEFVPAKGYGVIDLGEVGETAEVWLNGEYIGARVNAPYKFDISQATPGEKAKLTVKVIANSAHGKRISGLNSFISIPPTGITGDIFECSYEKI